MSFSERLKAATRDDHQAAHDTAFMRSLTSGEMSRDGFASLIAQHFFIYRALEAAPIPRPFADPRLRRVPSIEDDLEVLYGRGWRERISPAKATMTYVARIGQMSGWAPGLVAHHYTRYLGDLSGGQIIHRLVEPLYGEGCASFYVFPEIEKVGAYKRKYRAALDALGLDEVEERRMLGEVKLAYQLNIEVLDDLWRARSHAA